MVARMRTDLLREFIGGVIEQGKRRHPQAENIRSFAWDCTIGAGRVGDDFPDEPDYDTLEALKRILGHELTVDDRQELERAWHQCEMEQAYP